CLVLQVSCSAGVLFWRCLVLEGISEIPVSSNRGLDLAVRQIALVKRQQIFAAESALPVPVCRVRVFHVKDKLHCGTSTE
ncbi:hypothetical protein BaRGS_00008548, partial [Batillaria attramentaria]